MSIPDFDQLPLAAGMIADLQSDHAGECGAVMIYRGVLDVSRNPAVRSFAEQHLLGELRHRAFFDEWLPTRHQSRLLPLWKASGWILGAVAALFGQRGVYRTVAAVETFVESHYVAQIEAMRSKPELAALAAKLQQFCDDEVEHRNDAAARLHDAGGILARAWSRLIGVGSALGVKVARVV